MIRKVITVAGSDSGGGAGIQADLKTFQEYGAFGFTAITSILALNPVDWSHTITPMDPELVRKQFDNIFAGGSVDSLKTGLLGSTEIIEITREYIDKNKQQKIVIDPVMAVKGTTELLQPENVKRMKELLLPVATITTPNLVEAGILSELGELKTIEDMKIAAKKIHLLGVKNVVVKGGKRLPGTVAADVFYDGTNYQVLENNKIDTDTNHGAGCTFAAAITAGLAKGMSIEKAVTLAKDFVAAGIEQGLYANPHVGYIWHGAYNQAEKRLP